MSNGLFDLREIDLVDEVFEFVEWLLFRLLSTNADIVFVYHVIAKEVFVLQLVFDLWKVFMELVFGLLEEVKFLLYFFETRVGLAEVELVLKWLREFDEAALNNELKTHQFEVGVNVTLTVRVEQEIVHLVSLISSRLRAVLLLWFCVDYIDGLSSKPE